MGLKGKEYWGKNSLDWQIKTSKGLGIFSAMKEIAGGYDPRYRSTSAHISINSQLSDNFLLRSTISAQNSDAKAPTSAYISIGSRNNVRGFHDNSIYGPDGFYLTNNLETSTYKLTPKINISGYYGLDYGRIKKHANIDVNQNYLIGHAVGIRVNIPFGYMELAYAQALSRPEEFEDEKSNHFYGSIRFSY